MKRGHNVADPKRIQMKRTRGWRKPPNTVYVGRPSKWGNPFDWQRCQDLYGVKSRVARQSVTDAFRRAVLGRGHISADFDKHFDRIRADIEELRGKGLACWCPLDAPCHADVLLELANKEKP